ncbi:GntR family transcriptional regulator [Rhodopseudomonas sp. RCAM05734]|uniref:GntR family transcriptional regulator n=1 Tax=Rhodopseudomonas sp. RCAM05734 TaxID=3457549 RepID=UPI004044E47F
MTASSAIATAGEVAYKRIRGDILFGKLAPGRKLKLDLLRAEYQTSVSTLREILSRLSSEKLVVAEGQRGFEVAPISAQNLKEVAALRQLLEKHALEQSFAQGDIDWEARVVAAHHKLAMMEDRMQSGELGVTEIWKQYDWQFHQALVSACGSGLLMQTHAAVFEKYLRYQMISLGFRGDVAVDEHRRLLDCALQRDARSAQAILDTHVEGGLRHALAANELP